MGDATIVVWTRLQLLYLPDCSILGNPGSYGQLSVSYERKVSKRQAFMYRFIRSFPWYRSRFFACTVQTSGAMKQSHPTHRSIFLMMQLVSKKSLNILQLLD